MNNNYPHGIYSLIFAVDEFMLDVSVYDVVSSLLRLYKNSEHEYIGTFTREDTEYEVRVNAKSNTIYINDEPSDIVLFIKLYDKDMYAYKYLEKISGLSQLDYICGIRLNDTSIRLVEIPGKKTLRGDFVEYRKKDLDDGVFEKGIERIKGKVSIVSNYKSFSNMSWLDDEIERNKTSEGRNEYSDWYYSTLEEIRYAQEHGTIDDVLYKELGKHKGDAAVAYGYYLANIHYDLFNPTSDKTSLEDRILYFIDNTDKATLRQGSWFTDNFLINFRYFLSNFIYHQEIDCDEVEWISKYGDDKENKILSKVRGIIKDAV